MSKRKNKTDYLAQLEKDMVLVEKGSFMMGGEEYASEQPIHQVTFYQDFYICKYLVTQGVWKAVMGEENNPSHFKGDNRPVENVSWFEISQTFLPKLNAQTNGNYRLPTEAEWEYAARGGRNGNNDLRYSGSNYLKEVGWFSYNSYYETKQVGIKKGNELGIYDISGNIWEWCQDIWNKNYNNVPNDGSAQINEGDKSRRVLRGGSCRSKYNDCRVSVRNSNFTVLRNDFLGFRVAQD